ncbi:MAG: Ig-like domain-containing protein, partial [Acidimicrobiia bacterium]
MRARMRFLVALFVSLFATPALLVSSAGPSAAMLPRQSGTIPCSTDSSGHDTLSFVSPMTGVAVFDGGGLASVTAVTGGSEHEIDGGTIALATVAGVTHTIHVAGPPSTSCIVLYGLDNTPDNDDVSAAVPLTASMLGITSGSTRAATIAPDEPAPTAGALRVVWFRWTGSTGTATFTAEPQSGGGLTDPASGVTATGVAVYDASNLNAPLQVGGDGVAYQDAGGSGGSVTVATTAGTEYLIAVFSAGGTGTHASQYGYPSAGAFTLTWSTPPDVRDDVARTDPGTPVDIAVLANDSDSDGDALTVTSFATLGNLGSSVSRSASDPNVLEYTPGVDVDRYDYFTYDVDDGDGNIVTGLVMVYVGIPIPPPALIQVTPDPIDFGAVPIGKVPMIDVTIKNVSQNEVFV